VLLGKDSSLKQRALLTIGTTNAQLATRP